ncbi:NAD(P)-binding protein [Daldinia grandis]|nr:NAD(P)-binding protein [Daldinia grandis]
MSASFDLGSPLCTKIKRPLDNTNIEGNAASMMGSTSGLGLKASQQPLGIGLAELIVTVRSIEKGAQAVSELRSQFPEASIRCWFSESIRRFLARISLLSTRVNFLYTMPLAILLLPILKADSPPSQPSQPTIDNSGTTRGVKIPEPQGTPVLSLLGDKSRSLNLIECYAVSKLLGHLFVANLVHYVNVDHVIVNPMDLGLIKNTPIQSFALPIVVAFFYRYKAVLGRSCQKDSHDCLVANWKIS